MYSFKTVPSDLRDTSAWRLPEFSILTEDKQEKFLRLQKAIRHGLEDGSITEAAKEARCSSHELRRLLNRCLTLDAFGKPVGWYGLWPEARVKPYERTADLPTRKDAENRSSGAFTVLLRKFPTIVDCLNSAIGANEPDLPKGVRRKSRAVYQEFLRACKKENLGDNDYPLNTKDRGRRSVERYIKSRIESTPSTIDPWFGEDAADRNRLGGGKQSFEFATQPLDEVSYDAHHIDCLGVVIVPGPKGLQRVPVTRLWVGVLFDRYSASVLGYSIATCLEPTAAMVEEAFIMASTEWTPAQLRIPNLSYIQGAGLPYGTVPGMPACRPAKITLDNGSQHFSNRIINVLRKKLGCAMEYGSIGAWWHHSSIERFFETLENYGFHRLPSSTGTGPTDPLRRDPVGSAVRDAVEQWELMELAGVIFANYNAIPSRSLGNQSPLQLIANSLQFGDTPWLPRLAPPETLLSPKIGISVEFIFVRGSIKKGRAPYIQIDEVEYSSPDLSERYDLIDKRIAVHVDEWDMRQAKAFDAKTGDSLGCLLARGSWSLTKHSRADRKAVNSLRKSGEIIFDDAADPVICYLQHLARKALVESANNTSPKISKAGSMLARLTESTGLDVSCLQTTVLPRVASMPTELPIGVPKPNWSSVRRS